jgi:hypothetical protein
MFRLLRTYDSATFWWPEQANAQHLQGGKNMAEVFA